MIDGEKSEFNRSSHQDTMRCKCSGEKNEFNRSSRKTWWVVSVWCPDDIAENVLSVYGKLVFLLLANLIINRRFP
jgi:hypothetical protein